MDPGIHSVEYGIHGGIHRGYGKQNEDTCDVRKGYGGADVYTRVHGYASVLTHTRTRVYTRVHTCTRVYTCVHVDAHVYPCVHVDGKGTIT